MSELLVSRSHTSSQIIRKSSLIDLDQFTSIINHTPENNDFFKSCYRSQADDQKNGNDLQFLHVFTNTKHKQSDNLLETNNHIHNHTHILRPIEHSHSAQFNVNKIDGTQSRIISLDEFKMNKSANLLKTINYQSDNNTNKQIELRQSLLNQSDLDQQQYASITETRSISRIRNNNVKIQQNRLAKISKLNKERNKKEKLNWTWDTSAALIRLMIRRRTTRVIMNIYIWILLFLRGFYLLLIFYYMSTHEEELVSFTFFWLVFSVYFGTRILFSLIVLKILTMSNKSNDQKIKIVQQTYLQIIEENKLKLQQLQELELSHRLGGSYISTRQHTEQQKIIALRRKLITLQILMVIVPPEFSFIFLTSGKKQYNGYYQVQNFIMKSLEIFFFVPFLIYFLHDKLQFGDVLMVVPSFKIFYLTSLILIVDLALFVSLVIYLLINNQRKVQSHIKRTL